MVSVIAALVNPDGGTKPEVTETAVAETTAAEETSQAVADAVLASLNVSSFSEACGVEGAEWACAITTIEPQGSRDVAVYTAVELTKDEGRTIGSYVTTSSCDAVPQLEKVFVYDRKGVEMSMYGRPSIACS